VRSASASRAAAALLAAACAVASACGATSPPPLPPRRVAFAAQDPAHPAPPAPRPPDIARAAEPPIVHERYFGWILAADLVSLAPLVRWMGRPEDIYLAAPSLLLPPVIHTLYGEPGNAALSLTLRAAMVGAVYLAGRSAEEECEDSESYICIPVGSFLLADAAIVLVVVTDAVFLARTTRELDAWHRLPVVPSVSLTPDGRPALTLGGHF